MGKGGGNIKIYQPVAVVGFSFGGALLIMSLLPFGYTVFAIILAGMVFAGFLIFCLLRGFNLNRAVMCVALFMVLIGALVNTAQRVYWAHESAKFPMTSVKVTGTVEETFSSNGQTRSYLVKTEKIGVGGMSQKMKILLYGTADADFHVGERIACSVTGFRNIPSRSQLGRGAQVTGWMAAGTQMLLTEAPPDEQWMEDLVFRLKVNIKRAVPSPYDSILIAMLLGDSSQMDAGLYDSFNLTGISHILCVSGLHITLIGALITGLFQLVFGKRAFSDIMGLSAMIFFVILTGGKVSAVRALVMAATLMLTRHIVRDYSPINTLGGVVLFFCILDPSIVYHGGFLMSVVSVCALCAVSPCWTKAVLQKFSIQNGLLQYFVSILCSSSAVAVFLIPIMMLFNGYTSLLSPLANLLVLPMVPCVMILGTVSAIAGGAVGAFTGQMGGVLLKVMVSFTEMLGKAPFAILPLNLPYVSIWLFGTALLILILMTAKRLRKNKKWIAGVSVALLTIGMATHFISSHNTLQITALKSGGSGSIVVSQNGKALVIGCGGAVAQKTVYYMRSIGIYDFEMLVIPQNKARYAGGVARLVKLSEPVVILAPEEGNYLSAAYDLPHSNLMTLSASNWEVLDGISLKVGEGETPRMVLSGNGQEFFIDADGAFGVLQDGKEWLLERGQKGDTLEPKYDIITAESIEKLEQANFESVDRGETVVVRVAKNGKMTIRGK
ncbi:MAG: hypothetical protein DBY45_02900 [Clostridiales bacterium]|nr:MAG: hypothetical protein DBY45_02900 [Clostridiales bacterium]